MKRLRVLILASLVLSACDSHVPAPTARPASTPVATTATASTPPTASPASTPSPRPSPSIDPALRAMVGQKLVVAMQGTTPSADLLGRIGRGEVGGVILFGANITTPEALMALTGRLRDAAAAGGQPPLLIAVDQEGGLIKRVPWAPPTLSAAQMGRDGRASVALAQGESTGAALQGLGINVDLAPVADVPGSATSFLKRDGRTFASNAARTDALADAFASGLESAGVLPTMKHFPGIGLAAKNTDAYNVTIIATAAEFDPGLQPYRTAIEHDIPLVMLSNATYPIWDPANAAAWSPAIAITLLRDQMGFKGVTITDSLDGAAKSRHVSTRSLAVLAALAGTDLILVTGSEASTRAVYATLIRGAADGTIPAATLQASNERILALKAGL